MPKTTPVIWGQTSDGQDAYVHSCTKAVYNPETGKTLDEEMVTMQDAPAAITGETPIKPVGDASGNVICPQTRTAAVYDPVSGQTLDEVIHPAYGTEEQWTGEYWLDGKKIYRKYLSIPIEAATTTAHHLIDNIGDFKGFDTSKSCIEISANGTHSPVVLPVWFRDTYYTAVEYVPSGDKIAIYLGSELLNYKPVTAKLILLYTKNDT